MSFEEKGLFSIEESKIDNEVIANVVKRLKELKTITLSKSLDKMDKCGMNAVNVRAKLKEERETKPFTTGTLIDDMLNGGLMPTKSMLLYGEPATGKSEIMMTMTATAPDKILYIDAEGTFSARRLEQICIARGIDFDTVADKIVLFQPKDWIELMFLIYTLPDKKAIGKISLVFVDSLTALFRGIEFAGRGELNVKQPLMREIPIYLKQFAKVNNCSFVISTQVYQKPASTGAFMPEWTTFVPVGGASLLHQTSYNLFLRHGEKATQVARLTDADDVPLTETIFRITEAGVVRPPNTEKAQELLDKADTYAEKREKALDDAGKRGRKAKTADPTTQFVTAVSAVAPNKEAAADALTALAEVNAVLGEDEETEEENA